jgi:diketogulonate reductase-like aldo/keto reductase
LKDAFESGVVKREEVFITTKLWCTYHTRVESNLDKSLELLGLDYVDLYLMHWPVAMNPNGMVYWEQPYSIHVPMLSVAVTQPLLILCFNFLGNDEKFPKLVDGSRDLTLERSHVETYKDMEKLLATGKVKAIGVANYSLRYLNELLPQVTIVPAVNQIENHPELPQEEIVTFCQSRGIHVTAYSPLGSSGSPLLSIPTIKQIGQKRGVKPSTVLLNWHGMITSAFIAFIFITNG